MDQNVMNTDQHPSTTPEPASGEGSNVAPAPPLSALAKLLAVADGPPVPAPAPARPLTIKTSLLDENCTDVGNARRLVMLYRDSIHYIPQWKTWIIWDGRRWKRDDAGRIISLAKKTIRSFHRQALDGLHPERVVLLGWAMKSESRRALEAMEVLARNEDGVAIDAEALDVDHWLLNVKNGTLNLRTGRLQPHAQADLITKLAPTAYDPHATCPAFIKFFERVVPEDAMRDFLQRALGYSITGDTSEQCMFIPIGPGENGKGTLLETVRNVIGTDYGYVTPPETLLARKEDGRPKDDVARLKGARFVLASETEDGARLSEANMKRFTGQDRLPARSLYERYFEYDPQFKLWLAVNYAPIIHGTTRATWRRIHRIPFDVTITAEEKDKHLRDKLLAECTGILRWLVEGCLDWQHDGLKIPPSVLEATAAYREEMDTFSRFIAERTLLDQTATSPAADLYDTYVEWCQDNDVARPLVKKKFGVRLSSLGLRPGKAQGARIWQGIGLAPSNPTGPLGPTPDGSSYPHLGESDG